MYRIKQNKYYTLIHVIKAYPDPVLGYLWRFIVKYTEYFVNTF